MKFITTKYLKLGIALSLIAGMGAVSFAGNNVGDVPASSSELRPIERQTTLYNGSCDIEQDLAFYERSPVYLRIGQPKSTVNYVFDKTATYVMVYNQPLFQGNLKFPYVANFVPSSSFEPDSSNILTVEATGAIFSGGAMTMDRDEIAGQIITKNNERAALQNNAGASLNYYYKLANSTFTYKNGTIKINIHPQLTPKTSCTNYYVARCGDGVIDDGDTEGIEVDGDMIEWHSWSLEPNEECDNGDLNGTPGNNCLDDCTLGTTPGDGASCTLTASDTTIAPGETITINASYTSGTSATFTPSLSGLAAFTYPNRSSSVSDTLSATTTYTLTVQGATGTQPTTCSTTVTVEPHLQCTLTINPSIAGTGQIINIGWNVQNGTFGETDIYVTPGLAGGRPHTVYDNQYNGITTATAMYTGQYVFTMHVENSEESADCTGILNVIDDVAPCTLTTTTPVINIGQTAILQGMYSNGILANMTPFITGLNFTYPNRSNTNITVQPTSTTTYTMNVLGILGGSGKSCSTTVQVRNPGLDISKHVVTDIQYSEGDLVTFRLDFANNSSGTINNVSVSDYLPVSLDYVNSQIYGINPPFNYTTGTIPGSHHFVTYSSFSLAPGQQGYMLVVGRYRGNQYANYTINNATIQGDDSDPDYASAIFQTYKPTSNTTVLKTANKTSYYPGEQAAFTIAVTNNGPDTISNVTITDNRPASSCVTLNTNWMANMPLTVGSTTNPYTWIYNGNLSAGQTIYLYLTGMISNDPACIGTYTNRASISYTVNNQIRTGAAPDVIFTVSTTPTSTMVFEKRLVSYGSNPGDPVVFELLYRNNGGATITNFDVVDYRPGTLNFISASPMPTTQVPMPGGTELHRFMTTPLAPNGSGKITINGTIH